MTSSVRVAHLATTDLTLRSLLLPQLRAMRDAGYEVTAVSAPGPWVPSIVAEGIRFVPWLNATRAWDPFADARAFCELTQIVDKGRFHIVHTHNAKPGVMGRIAARAVRVPCIVNTVHGFDARPGDPFLKRLAFMGLEWTAAQFSDLELYQGREDQMRARRIAMLRRGKGVFLGNGTDLSMFDPAGVAPDRLVSLRGEWGMSGETLVVGAIGRLVGDKGYREFFRAARLVREEMPGVRFLVIGQEDSAKADRITSVELEEAGRDVVFAGWREDIPDLLALMDVFVLPSWREGVPRSAIEAAAMGKAMVLSDIPGCRQVARAGVEAILVPPRDPDRLTIAILRLLRDPELRRQMGEASRARACRFFDEQRVIQVILEQYERLLSQRSVVAA